jgi:hypothetical protein
MVTSDNERNSTGIDCGLSSRGNLPASFADLVDKAGPRVDRVECIEVLHAQALNTFNLVTKGLNLWDEARKLNR